MHQNTALEINEQNLQQVIEQSMQTPVVISFWAPSMPETLEVNATLEDAHKEFLIERVRRIQEERKYEAKKRTMEKLNG